jgi:hypothetical protein
LEFGHFRLPLSPARLGSNRPRSLLGLRIQTLLRWEFGHFRLPLSPIQMEFGRSR